MAIHATRTAGSSPTRLGELAGSAFRRSHDVQATPRQTRIDFARERLAHFECPKDVGSGELPKTVTGKIQRFSLREQVWAGLV